MIFTILLKNHMTNTPIFCIVIFKFCNEQQISSVMMLATDKNLKVFHYYSILSLILAIYLQVKSYKKFLLNAKKIA